MLTGNRPPALVRTHAYYEQPRWRRLIGPDVAKRHDSIHAGSGPTTAQRWHESHWPASLPDAPQPTAGVAPANQRTAAPRARGIGRALAARYPPVPCQRHQRSLWGPGGAAIPDQLRGEPGKWTSATLPGPVAELVGMQRVDLAQRAMRRRVLPVLLELGPAEAVAATVTFPQLRNEWPHLPLSPLLRQAWEDCYPALADDVTPEHPTDSYHHPSPR